MSKEEKLSEIYNEGVNEMMELLYDNPDEENETELDKYTDELTKVYEDCSDELSSACGIE